MSTIIETGNKKASPSKDGKDGKATSLKDAIERIQKEPSLFLMEVDKANNSLNLPETFMLFLESLVDIATATEKDETGIIEFALNKSERKRIDNLLNVLLGRSTWQKDGSFKYTGLLPVSPDQNNSIFERMGWDELKGSSRSSRSFTNSKGL